MKKFLAKAFGWLCVAAGVFGLIEGRFEGCSDVILCGLWTYFIHGLAPASPMGLMLIQTLGLTVRQNR